MIDTLNDIEFIQLVASLLKGESTLALATTADDGAPRVAPLFYICDDQLRLYWFSSPSSEHSLNVARNNDAAVTVYRSTDHWKEIWGVQMRGTVAVVSDRERRASVEREYIERFNLGTLFDAQIAGSALYVFEPTWLRSIDGREHREIRMV